MLGISTQSKVDIGTLPNNLANMEKFEKVDSAHFTFIKKKKNAALSIWKLHMAILRFQTYFD